MILGIFLLALNLSALDRFELPPEKEYNRAFGQEKGKGLHPGLLAAPILCGALDAYTTRRNIGAGGRELHPAMGGIADNPWALYGLLIGSRVLFSYGVNKVSKSGSEGLAKALIAGGTGASCAFPAYNEYQWQKRGRD